MANGNGRGSDNSLIVRHLIAPHHAAAVKYLTSAINSAVLTVLLFLSADIFELGFGKRGPLSLYFGNNSPELKTQKSQIVK